MTDPASTTTNRPLQSRAMSDRPSQILEAAVRVIAQDGVRGMRIEKLAAEAGVSTALIYHYFGDRSGVLRAALEAINTTAQRYTDDVATAAEPRSKIAELLLLEIQQKDAIRHNSVAWGELRACAVFDEGLRAPLKRTTADWNAQIAHLVGQGQAGGTIAQGVDAEAAAERLTTLVEGLSERWHSGSITMKRARQLVAGAVEIELGTS